MHVLYPPVRGESHSKAARHVPRIRSGRSLLVSSAAAACGPGGVGLPAPGGRVRRIMELKTVATRRVPVRYWEGGTGRPLVFLHGAGGVDADLGFLDALTARFHVYAPLVPGYGDSEECPDLRDML